MEYASNGKGNLGVTLGAIGTGLGILGGANLMGANSWGFNGFGYGGHERFVSPYELSLALSSMAKDSEIAMLKAEQDSEVKMADIYERVMKRVNEDRENQHKVNTEQAVFNATVGSQVAQLMRLTDLVIPARHVCPQPMPRYNSWEAPTEATT